jgi:hypothetical protein
MKHRASTRLSKLFPSFPSFPSVKSSVFLSFGIFCSSFLRSAHSSPYKEFALVTNHQGEDFVSYLALSCGEQPKGAFRVPWANRL